MSTPRSRAVLGLVAAASLAAACAAPVRDPDVELGRAPVAEPRTPEVRSAAEPEPAPAEPGPAAVQPAVQPGEPAGSEPERAPAGPAAPPVAGVELPSDLPVAVVNGQRIGVAELLATVLQRDTLVLREHLDRLVSSYLALQEAGRLGIVLDPALVDERVTADRGAVAEAVERGGSGLSVEAFIRVQFGLDPERYFERMRRESIQRLVTERAVRAWLLGSERVEARAIVAPDEGVLEQVRAALAAGRPFGEVAREFSVDESASKGGRIQPITLSERTPISQLAFATPVGEIGGPMPLDDTSSLLLLVEGRPEPLEGDWSAIGAAVEASLREKPVGDPEFWPWRLEMERRYPVDLTPFYELVGEPLP